MTSTIDDLSPIDRRHSRLLQLLANATAIYPLFLIGLIYGEWLLSWHLLGHKPEWSTDDPVRISGSSWIYPIAMLSLIGMMPGAVVACISNAAYLFDFRPSAIRGVIRLQTILAIWLGVYVCLQRDPYGVMEWWLD